MKPMRLPVHTRRRATRERIRYNAKRRKLWLTSGQVEKRLERECGVKGDPRYFWPDGRPMSFKWYIRRIEDRRCSRVVEQTMVSPDVQVSTVWLGLDHGFGGLLGEQPIIFETMVFRRDRESGRPEFEGDEQERYATEAEALAGHERMVAEVRAELEGKLVRMRA